jgi:alkylation response protein AidB-like acyl-CoA dehydrogenase
LVASSLLLYGTREQQQRYLPRIRTYEDFWCQLFSEPDAGSDLASLRCRADHDENGWVINGQKVWTTHGHVADLGFLLARSERDAPKHQGISAFIVDMRSPGIEVRPLREITGSNDFNEVFFTDVRIPGSGLIGAPGQGWAVARSSLARERSESRREESVTQAVARLATLARNGDSPAADEVRGRIGRLYARAEISDMLGYLQLENAIAGIGEIDDAAITKVFFGDLNLDIQRTALELQGARGVLAEGDPEAADNGRWLEGFLWARGFTISAGSNELMRNQIAERGLGLPRD